MSSKRWLKAEIRKWVQNDLITPSEGNAILAQYGEESHSYQGIFFIMASLSIGAVWPNHTSLSEMEEIVRENTFGKVIPFHNEHMPWHEEMVEF